VPRFRAVRPLSARWRSLDGLQHLHLHPDRDRIVADAVVVGGAGGTAYGVRYRLVLDSHWVTRSVDIETTDGRLFHVRSDGAGHWLDADGHPLSQFDGCIDVDLEGSPFTNTLPIRRMKIGPKSGAVEMKMLYIPFDTFNPFVDEQRYSCTKPRHYHYEAVDGSFTADLTVDDDGLVVDYPPLFRRVAS
jgi:uncharacterized protein